MAKRWPLTDIPLDVVEEWKFKGSLIKLLILCACPFTMHYVIEDFRSADYFSATIGVAFLIVFILSLILFKTDRGLIRHVHFAVISRLFFVALFVFHFYAFTLLGNFSTLPQMIMYPFLVIIILGRSEGHIWSGMYLFIVGGGAIYRFSTDVVILDPGDTIVSVVFVFILVTVDIVMLESVRQRGYLKLLEHQRELQESGDQYREINLRLENEVKDHQKTASDLKEQTRKANAANQSKSEFLANMSHELRTPLNHVIGFTELVNEGGAGTVTDRQREYLGDAIGSGRHLLALINDVLDFAKIDAGKLTADTDTIDIEAFLDNSMSVVGEQAERRRLRLEARNESGESSFVGDERKLKQVMYNLVSNAVEYTSDGGMISVVVSKQADGEILFKVSDNGIGVESENLERIFEPFEQEDNTVSRVHNGTGIGLSLSRRIVELHQGRIWAESDGRHKGSSFYFTVPVPGEV